MCVPLATRLPSMEAGIKTGKTARHGFTVMELMVVMVLLAVLASIVTPVISKSIQRAKEATLKENLFVIRKAIDEFYADHANYPASLESLVQKRYIRKLAADPITERVDSWVLVWTQGIQDNGERGIIDLHSGSEQKSSAGTPYQEW